MNKKLFLALVVLFASSSRMWAADGDTFKANTAEGVEMEFKVISESEKTCQVGDGLFSGSSIPDKTTGTITIPSQVNGYQITTIGDYAFSYCEGLTSITIPEGVNSIGQSAFKDCSGLTSITIPEGVKSIGLSAFYNCI